MNRTLPFIAALLMLPATAPLAAPLVATDIPPIHGLVSRVMDGVGKPELVMPPGASPHTHAMRPSEAALLQNAELVVWVGEGLTPWLATAIPNVAARAEVLELLEVPGIVQLPFRDGATFEPHTHDHGHSHGHAHDHGHAAAHGHADAHGHSHGHSHDQVQAHSHDHGHGHGHTHDHGHAAAHGHTHGHSHDQAQAHSHDHGHSHGHAHDHGHAAAHDHADAHSHTHDQAQAHSHDHGHSHGHHHHGDFDPHAWLDPVNARLWVGAIAEALSAIDPDNAEIYAANAAAAKEELDALMEDLAAKLAPIRGRHFVVFHDAYQYFEARFGVEAVGAIALSDATMPGPARVAEIRRTIGDLEAVCVFSEPQFEPRLVATVTDGSGARTGVLDPLGADIALGPDFYAALLTQMAGSLVGCLAES